MATKTPAYWVHGIANTERARVSTGKHPKFNHLCIIHTVTYSESIFSRTGCSKAALIVTIPRLLPTSTNSSPAPRPNFDPYSLRACSCNATVTPISSDGAQIPTAFPPIVDGVTCSVLRVSAIKAAAMWRRARCHTACRAGYGMGTRERCLWVPPNGT